jgi:hypothetical protein
MIDPQLPDEGAVSTSDRILRQFAGLCLVILGGLACYTGFVRERPVAAVVLATLAAVLGGLGLVRPQAIRPVFVGLMALTWPIGWVVSHALLAALYYGLFTPLGLLFRLSGRDALARRPRAGMPTYWAPKRAPADVQSYFRPS